MPQFRVRIEETAVYDVIVSGRNYEDARNHGLEAFKQGYGDFIANIEREVIDCVKHANT